MLLRRLPIFACLLLNSASRSLADGEITLALQLRTFPELAQALSANGRTVVCPTSFALRVALIHLEKRNWEATRALLQSGLGIRIRRQDDKPDTWLMEPDPALESRGDRWLMKMAELTVLAARESVGDNAELASMPYEEAIRAYLRAEAYRQALELADPQMENEETQKAVVQADTADAVTYFPAYYGARLALRLRAIEVFRAMKEVQRLQPADVGQLHLSPVVREFANYKVAQIRKDLREAGEANAQLERAIVARLEEIFGGPWRVSARLDFDTQSGSTRGQIVSMAPRHAETTTGFSADPVQDMWTEVIPKLGRDAAEWLEKDEAERAALMKDPAATRPIKPEKGADLSSLSQWLQTWAEQNGAEIVMELQPGRETVVATGEGGEGIPVSFPPAATAVRRSGLPVTLKEVMATTQPGACWSVRRTEGVWLFTNRQQFVDRLRECPTAGLFALERRLIEQGDKAQSLDYPLGALAVFHQSISAEQNAALAGLVYYRGMDLASIATARPAVQILASLSPAQRTHIAAELKDGKPFDLSLSTVSQSVMNAVAASMREMALSPRGYSVPDTTLTDSAIQSLRSYSLRLRPGEARTRTSVVAAFVLTHPTPLDIAEDQLEVEIPGLLGPR